MFAHVVVGVVSVSRGCVQVLVSVMTFVAVEAHHGRGTAIRCIFKGRRRVRRQGGKAAISASRREDQLWRVVGQ